MVAVGVVKGFKLLVSRDESIYQVHRILEVDIVISRPMNQQEIALQFVDMGDGTVRLAEAERAGGNGEGPPPKSPRRPIAAAQRSASHERAFRTSATGIGRARARGRRKARRGKQEAIK